MRLLLDTHSLLWFLLNDLRLSAAANGLIADAHNDIEISPASYWEIAIKISLGKDSLPERYEVFVEREIAANDFRICLPNQEIVVTVAVCDSLEAFLEIQGLICVTIFDRAAEL